MPPANATGTAARSSPKSSRDTDRTCSDSSSIASAIRALARRSPLLATSTTVPTSPAKSDGVAAAAQAMSPWTSGTSHAARMELVSAVSGSRLSLAAATLPSARRPSQAPLPSSPRMGPQPPARAVRPVGPRPSAIEPVPTMSITPGPSPNASSKAMAASEWTTVSSATSSSTNARQSASRLSSRPVPATPAQRARGRRWPSSALISASRTSAEITSADASASPGRTALGPPAASASTVPRSSATSTRVRVPPPSTPTTITLTASGLVRVVARSNREGRAWRKRNGAWSRPLEDGSTTPLTT